MRIEEGTRSIIYGRGKKEKSIYLLPYPEGRKNRDHGRRRREGKN